MKILELRAENIKRLTVVRIRPSGKLVEITGKNGQGKTSVLDSIWWALAGTTTIQEQPIRDGAQEALVHLDMGDLKVTRRFTRQDNGNPAYTTRLTVEAADGSRMRTPQTVLDAMIGAMSFEPMGFLRKLPREQYDILRSFVSGVDFGAYDHEQQSDYTKRTDENRRAADLKAQAAGINVPPDAPTMTVDVADLVQVLEAAGEKNTELEKRRARRNEAQAKVAHLTAMADRAQDQVTAMVDSMTKLKAQVLQHRKEAADLAAKLHKAEALPEPLDTTVLTEKIRVAQEANETARMARQKRELLAQALHHEQASTALTASMDARKAHLQAAVAAARMPIEELGFGDAEVLLNGRPIGQASDAEQLRASIAIAIALNPKIRVVRVRDGSLLDEDGLKLIAQMAEAADCQVWIERVANDGKVGFVMEDGHVKGQ